MSHLSAAALHGLPLWGVPLRTVHVTRDARSGGRRTRLLHVHPAPIGPDEVVTVRGLRVTSPARTVVDIARTARFESAVVIADAALKAALCTRQDLEAAVARAGRRCGGPASRRVVAFANGLADGPCARTRCVPSRACGPSCAGPGVTSRSSTSWPPGCAPYSAGIEV
ncbi:MAG: hypothetical protein M3235_10370, partial [Actinomycetota bacterium]|nr:hypothetical protein [Actinomycetota bacterium]